MKAKKTAREQVRFRSMKRSSKTALSVKLFYESLREIR